MAKANLGKAYVQIVPSADGITNSVTKLLEPESRNAGDKSGKSFGKKFIAAVGAAGITTAITKFFTDSVKAGAAYEQAIGGTKQVFGEFADEIQTNARKAYKNMGQSATEYMATANKMASLFQGSGLEQERALNLTMDAMQRAADVASVMGIDTSAALEAITGAAKGNFTMMDNLGVAMNATTLQAYALEKGVNFKWDTASNAEKAELAMQMFFERTSQYAGNFARESEETVSGSFASMKAAYDNLLAGMAMGEDVKPLLEDLSKTVGVFLGENLIPMILTAVGGLLEGLWSTVTNWGGELIGNINQWGRDTREAIFKPFKNAWEDVTGWFSDLKQKFAERLKFSGIDLPHIQLSYKTTGTMAEIAKKLGLKGVPQFSVEWYAKGGIFSNPSLIGVGEAGSEAVVPLNRFWTEIDNMANKIVERIDSINGNQQPIYCYVTLDGKVIAKATAPYIDNELGTIQQLKGRGVW